MRVVLYDMIFLFGFWRSGRVQKKRSPVNTATISVMLLQAMPNNKTYVKAKDAYNLYDAHEKRTHVIT